MTAWRRFRTALRPTLLQLYNVLSSPLKWVIQQV